MPPSEYLPTVRLETCNGRSVLASRTALPAHSGRIVSRTKPDAPRTDSGQRTDRSAHAKVASPKRQRPLRLGGRNRSSCPKPNYGRGLQSAAAFRLFLCLGDGAESLLRAACAYENV